MSEQTLTVKVNKREVQGSDVVVLELTDPAGQPLPAYEAGAHIDLHLANGLVRQYSLCSDPDQQDYYRLGVLKDPNSRGGSQAVFDTLMPGVELEISLPRNLFPLTEKSPRSVLIGGGIGVTPMISMAHRLHNLQQDFDLWYCARERSHCGFINELIAAPFAAKVHPYFTAEHSGQRLDFHTTLPDPVTGTHLYVCGPEHFMQCVIDTAVDMGYDDAHIHREYFNVEVETSGNTFEVVAAQSGISVTVLEDQTIAQALKEAGIKVQVACEQGTCGTCLCDVLEGTPDHRDVYLTDEEKEDNDQITLCCSRARSAKLVLDI
ncbi:2Fe-2S iron-sulfur cluster binding domain-containing protein [Vibrio sp. CAIM 722]|uniref:2Fe-2S iron-sulfur cluster binding domain-containing protein n=1 Tax=Vibrio eleionomae TaxID=2653505 RepID=A0A7X4LP63_9VIBR|nr:PDR/VanB family oxidoreductase [Vibrio eleionomae]MZI95598.1 2Fe-2S iron-sulfur cluster binding domain-containing protein [Vibrio eleionomae]